MAALLAQSTTAPSPNVPLVGIVAVSLPADSEPLRWAWVDTDMLMVGYDPRVLTRELAAMAIRYQIGEFLDIDAEVTA